MTDNNAKRCLAICPLFEAELLLELMLRHWGHPFTGDNAFQQSVLESAAELLVTASDETCSELFIEGLPANDMNFVSAVWYVEWCGVQDDDRERDSRHKWLTDVRHALPSCFCRLDLLEP